MTLDELQPGEAALIKVVHGTGALRHHLLDMGLTPRTHVELVKRAPMGDPIQVKVRGYELTLRLDEARLLTMEGLHDEEAANVPAAKWHFSIPHPGVGEFDRAPSYHHHDKATEIPEGAPMSFALVGNQNCGKTTLFNQLTGANQHVGNFPGVTVDRKDGQMKLHPEARVTDLPGIYSLSPYSNEEIVTRDFLLQTHPDGIINIVDATNLERNLYLTMQIMELGIPMVLALNMMDEVRENGGAIHINELEATLGIPVIPIAAAKNEGIAELVEHAIHVARNHEKPMRIDFCADSDDPDDPVAAVHRGIHAMAHLIEPLAEKAGLPIRFAATKLIEHDPLVEAKLQIPPEQKPIYDQISAVMEQESGLDAEAALANMRFTFITGLCKETIVRPHESKEHRRSAQMDRYLTGKYTAIPIFIAIMGFIFVMTFNGIGALLTGGMEWIVGGITDAIDAGLTAADVNPVMHALVIDGIVQGVGTVISFLPTIVTLYFFLSILEDTGYMARVAFVMDRLLRRIGLSGRSIVPLLVGCRFRLLRAGHHGDAHAVVRPRPQDDDSPDAVHELQCEAADLHVDHRRVLPAAVSGARHDFALHPRHLLRRPLCARARPHALPRRAGAVRHGTAELPHPVGQKRRAPRLGQVERLRHEGVHDYLRGIHRHLVPPDVRWPAESRGHAR